MLKNINKKLNNYFVNPNEDGYNCHTESYQTIDTEKTAANRSQCKSDAQDKITKIEEDIEKYEALKADIIAKQEEGEQLVSDFNKGTELITEANINTSLELCVDCVDNLGTVFTNMLQECEEKLTQLGLDKEAAEREKEACDSDSSLIAYKTAYRQVCEQYTK